MGTSSKEQDPPTSRGRDAADFDVIPRPKRPLLPCYLLGQPRNKAFYGRKQVLDQVHHALALPGETDPTVGGAEISAPSLPKVFIIYSMGGMGKTEIAIEYMHSHKTDFDAIFWVDSASEAKLNACFRNVAIKLGLQNETDPRDDPIATKNIVKAWLSHPVRVWGLGSSGQDPDVRWLLVFDNVDDPDLLTDFWPTDGAGSILVTSRNPLVTLGISSELPAIDLPPMPIEEASLFLQKLSSRKDEGGSLETCAKIASRLGGLPLAVVQMAYAIRRKHLSLKEFVERYEEDAQSFQESPVPGPTKDQTIASTWNIESLRPSARALLGVLSVLDPDAIPEDILMTGVNGVDLENYPRTKKAYFDAREELLRSSLISRNGDLGFVKIHRLVQDVVRQKMSIDELRETYDAGVTLVSAVWPFLDGSNLNRVDRLGQVHRFLPQVAALKVVLEGKTPSVLQPNIGISALLNEISS